MSKDQKVDNARRGMPCLRWRGLMSGYDGRTRRIMLVILWVFSVALSFTQLGFVGLGVPGAYSGYMVVLLMPIALSAILLGTRVSTLTGLFAGAVALLHANMMPLDYCEFAFVNPYSSVVTLTVTGFLLGVSLSKALGTGRATWERCLLVALACVGAACVHAIGFGGNALMLVATRLMALVPETEAAVSAPDALPSLQVQLLSMVSADGVLVSVGMNALNMTGCSCLAMLGVDMLGDPSTKRTVRFALNSALMAVAVIAFCGTSALSYVGISAVEFARGSAWARDSVGYIAEQLDSRQERATAVESLLSELMAGDDGSLAQLSDEQLLRLATAFSMQDLLEGYSVGEDGYVFVGSIEGNYAYLSDTDFDGLGHGSSMPCLDELLNAEVIDAARQSKVSGLVVKTVYDHAHRDMVRGIKESGDTLQGVRDSLARIDLGNGTTAELMYVLAAESRETGEDIILMVPSDLMYPTRNITMLAVSLTFGTLMTLVFVMISKLSDRIVVRRIHAINDALGDIEGGDLSVRADVRDTVEFDELSDHVNTAVGALGNLIDQARRQNEEEMAAAKAIQESAIPRTFPPYPDKHHFDIYATMSAAKDVGGDFYDFFVTGGGPGGEADRLVFMMADVSGKGIPAALFMMKADTALRDCLSEGTGIGEAITNVNRQLCENNDANMFVTAWVGSLDCMTGHLEFVNAGHNPPMMLSRDEGKWSWIRQRSGMALGLFDDEEYEAFGIDLLPGDEVLLYTDGVTEAFSVAREPFGEDGLERLLRNRVVERPRKLVDLVRHAVAEHARGAEQFDDITVLALQFGVPSEPADGSHADADTPEPTTAGD